MKTVLALLALRLKQARAGRLPWLAAVHLVLVGGVLLFARAPTPQGRLRVALSASLTLAALIATVGAVAFGASLLPDERESRRIHRVLAAPVGHITLAGATFGASMTIALALAVGLTLLSLPLLALVGDTQARDEVFSSTHRIFPARIEALGEERELEGRLWIYGDNPGVTWTVNLGDSDLGEGDVRGEIRVSRRLDRGGALKATVPVGITVAGGEERVVRLGPDRPVPVVVPAEVAGHGEITVTLRRLDPAYVLGVSLQSLRLDGRRRSFLPEYVLAAIGSGLVAALLTALAVAVSTVASAGVATATALAIGLVGSLRGFLVRAADSLVSGAGHGPASPAEPSTLDVLAAGIVRAVAWVSPDVGALSMAGPLQAGDVATLGALHRGLDDFLIGTALALVLGWMLLRTREYP